MASKARQSQKNRLIQQYSPTNHGSGGVSGDQSFLHNNTQNIIFGSPKGTLNNLDVISPPHPNAFFNSNSINSPNTNALSPLCLINNTNIKANDSILLPVQSEDSNSTHTNPPKKLKYSRRGCSSCKKRRKKCSNDTGDGTTCWDCKRLGRECIYVYNPKNVQRKTTPRKKTTRKAVKKDIPENKKQPTSAGTKFSEGKNNGDSFLSGLDLDSVDVNLIFQNLNDIVSMKLNDSQLNLDDYNTISLDDVFTKSNKTVPTNINYKNHMETQEASPLNLSASQVNHVKQESFTPNIMNYNELVIEASELSNFNRSILPQPTLSAIALNQIHSSLRDSPMPSSLLGEKKSPKTPIESIPTTVSIDSPITVNTPLESFNLGTDHDKYLKVFYYDCMDSIAPFTQHQINPLRDALLSFAKTEDYLLSSILAIGASISNRKKPLSINKTNLLSPVQNKYQSKAYDEDNEDERFYCQYLNHCLSLLSSQFQEEGVLLSKIEPIILTVILLAWDCVYSMNSQWRSHLQGVTKLFEKINCDSKLLNLCKCWFKVIETFAHISTVLGGSLVEDYDLDNIFNLENETYFNSLKSLNIIIPLKSEFNLLRGHAESFDCVIKEVIKNLNHIRKSEKNYFEEKGIFNKNLDYLLWNSTTTKVVNDEFDDKLSYFRIQKILNDIDSQLEIEFINKSGIIPIEDPFHPLNLFNQNKTTAKDFGVDLITLIDNQQIAISWYDISHQCQVLSFLLIVLLKFIGLPKDSIIIQEIVTKICSKFDWLLNSRSPPENLRTCYCNFAILLAGLNANQSRNRDIVRQYYKLNGKRFQRLTKHNLLRLEKTWNKGSEDSSTDEVYTLEGQDVLTW